MTPLVPIAMFGWIPFTIILFSNLAPQRAAVICVAGGFLFLPVAEYNLPGIPAYDKFVAISISLLLGGILSAQRNRYRLKLRSLDIPMILWCFVVPFATSFSNDLGLYEALSIMMDHLLHYGILYWTGRRYFSSPSSLRTLSYGVILGGLVYIPLILFELRMSPQLSNIVYGFFPHSFLQHIRYGGWRPIVFTQHGLSLSFWMAVSSTVTIWLWRTKTITNIRGIPIGPLAILLALITVLCKSASGWFYLIAGFAGVAVFKKTRSTRLIKWTLMTVLLYLIVRLTNIITIEQVRSFATLFFDEERVYSLFFRLRQEDLFGAMSFRRPFFGWGGYRRGWPIDPLIGREIEIVDSLWVILFNVFGFLGLSSVFLAYGHGPWKISKSYLRPRQTAEGLKDPFFIDSIVLSLVVSFFLVDSLINGPQGHFYLLCAGALANCCPRTSNAVEESSPVSETQPYHSRDVDRNPVSLS